MAPSLLIEFGFETPRRPRLDILIARIASGTRRASAGLSTKRPNYSLGAGGFASGAGAGATGSAGVPRSSDGAAQSPAQSLVPLTVPTSLQPIGVDGFACFPDLPPLGAAV